VKAFIEESGFSVVQVENYPGEISRKIRDARACFAAADTLKFYFPNFGPYSDGNFILLKIIEIMAHQKDLISSIVKGFPKGIKINKTLAISESNIDNIHNRLIEYTEDHGYRYHDIINELKIIDEGVYTIIKVDLYRNALLLSSESEDKSLARKMIDDISKTIERFE
jgi:phosphomannomutase